MTRDAPTISVDFNRLDDKDVLWAPRDLAPDADVHEPVILYDGDGNRCLGIVKSMDARRIYIQAVLSTWQDAEPVDVTVESEALDDVLRRQVRVVTNEQLTVGVNTLE